MAQSQLLSNTLHKERHRGRIVLRRRWFTWRYVFGAIMFVAGASVFAFYFFQDIPPELFWLFASVLGAVAAVVFYFILAKLMNSDLISISEATVHVENGPLPFPGKVSVPRAQIVHLEKVRRRYKGRSPRPYFDINAVHVDGGSTPLIRHIENEQQADELLRSLGGHLT